MDLAISENEKTVQQIRETYLSSTHPWYLGFSGGKDSSAILKLTFLALQDLQIKKPKVTILYCDTGVDIPIIKSLVEKTLKKIEEEARIHCVPLHVKIVKPLVKDTYFSKVIGKGYPTPTNKFRWCTDRLRIWPIDKILKNVGSSLGNVVLLGLRKGESVERDKTIIKHETEKDYFFRQSNNSKTMIYAPILNYSVEDVWATIAYNDIPKSIDATRLMQLYRQAGGECPIIRDPKGTPCGKGRFGCWTCTVVRKDKSVQALVDEGYSDLKPLLEFRNWLIKVRDDPNYRSMKRRNGAEGLGPFTLAARQEILQRLISAEKDSGYKLIEKDELEFIEKCWDEDKGKF
jgi:DNA sulfur modification protein DndC